MSQPLVCFILTPDGQMVEQRPPVMKAAEEVIVIDSSDSEDEKKVTSLVFTVWAHALLAY
jgi:hypothetical protein